MPATIVYALVVWLLCGVLTNHWWWQIGCFAVTTYLMVLLNNTNVLIRIFSRMVSSSFLALSCAACFLFPVLREAVMITCLAAFTLLLFHTYQDKKAAGLTYYAFLFFGVASIAYVHVLFFLPLIWLMMITNTMSMSWRTWTASLLGLLTPYWFGCIWLLYQRDYTPAIEHFSALSVFEEPFNLYGITGYQKVTLALIILLAIIGGIHFIHKNYLDKIRVRMFLYIYASQTVLLTAFLVLQPVHYETTMALLVASASPLIAHYFALTGSWFSTIIFLLSLLLTAGMATLNLWLTTFTPY